MFPALASHSQARARNSLGSPSSSNALKPARPSTSALTLSSASSLNLLTTLEQQLCSTLRILPKPYLYLKEVLLREWARMGGAMTGDDARRAVGREVQGGEGRERERVEGEWGEKVERVFEFLVDTGGLRRRERRFEEIVEAEDEESAGQKAGLTLPLPPNEGEAMEVEAETQ